MKKLLGSLAILIGLAAPAQAQLYLYCIIGGAAVLNIRDVPNGAVIGHLPAGTAITAIENAPPWVYITSEYGDGWIWGNYIEAGCVPPPSGCCVAYIPPPPPPPCYNGCGALPVAPRAPMVPQHHQQQEQQYEEAPAPNQPEDDYKPHYSPK